MPVLFIEAPRGIRSEAKKKMMEKITAAIDEAYPIGDILIRAETGKNKETWTCQIQTR